MFEKRMLRVFYLERDHVEGVVGHPVKDLRRGFGQY